MTRTGGYIFLAAGPRGLYQGHFNIEPCEAGFRVTVIGVQLLKTTELTGTDVSVDGLESLVVPTERQAVQVAEARFKLWATAHGTRT